MTRFVDRREFLQQAMAGGVAFALPVWTRHAWAATDAVGGELKLVFFSDVHARTEWGTPEALSLAADAINAEEPDLIIACGDLITDGFQSSAETVAPRWHTYMQFHDALEADTYAVLGNHDLVAAIPEDGTEASIDPRGIFREKFGLDQTYYSFDAGGYHFMVLDSINVLGEKAKYQGLIGPEQMAWIRDDLGKVANDTPIVVALHIPLLTAFYQATSGGTASTPVGRVIVNNVDVFDLFRDHNLLLVLQGHLHVKELLRWKDTTFINGGALSGKWWRGSYFDTPEGYNVVTLKGNEIDWEFKSYGWVARRPGNQ